MQTKSIPVMWNKINGNLCVPYFSKNIYQESSKEILFMDLHDLINNYVKKHYNGFLEIKYVETLYAIYKNMVSNLKKFPELEEVWELCGWILPTNIHQIQSITPMKKKL